MRKLMLTWGRVRKIRRLWDGGKLDWAYTLAKFGLSERELRDIVERRTHIEKEW